MNTLSAYKCGLILGGFLGLFHLAWSLLVAFGLAQPFMDFIFRLHMIAPVYIIQPFNIGSAVLLVIVTALLGFVSGSVLGMIWNRVVKMK